MTIEASDYKKVDGINMPHKQAFSSDLGEYTIVLDKVQFNEKIDAEKFALPDAIKKIVEGGEEDEDE